MIWFYCIFKEISPGAHGTGRCFVIIFVQHRPIVWFWGAAVKKSNDEGHKHKQKSRAT
jgi:hypothetical protein